MINWKVRFRNKTWVMGFISQVMIVIQMGLVGANAMGLTNFQLTEEIQSWVLVFANAVFVVLASLGLVQDPTTDTLTDSNQAMRYDSPKK